MPRYARAQALSTELLSEYSLKNTYWRSPVKEEGLLTSRQKAICRDCKWWELLEEDPAVGDHGVCHNPVAEAQYIAHMGESAPGGLAMEGARRSCSAFELTKNADSCPHS